MQPTYYKALWHNCNKCRTHYMSEEPHLKAYLCDECWNSVPHYIVQAKPVKRKVKKKDISWAEITLYTLGNILCLGVIAYYLWFK
jgi:hypothetical protein